MPARRRVRAAAGGANGGSASIQMVLLMPALFAVMFLGMQAALYYHARTVAIAAAQEGARAAGAEDGTASAGITAATELPGRHRRRRPHRTPPSPAARTATTATVTVRGVALSVIPGWRPADHPVRQPSRSRGSPDEPQPRPSERGSAALEAAIGLPAFMLFVALIILAGRLAIATQAVDAAAAEAARAASIARTQGAASSTASTAAASSLANQNLRCVRHHGHARHHRLRRPVGTPAAVTATVHLRGRPSRPGPARPPRHQDRHRAPRPHRSTPTGSDDP